MVKFFRLIAWTTIIFAMVRLGMDEYWVFRDRKIVDVGVDRFLGEFLLTAVSQLHTICLGAILLALLHIFEIDTSEETQAPKSSGEAAAK